MKLLAMLTLSVFALGSFEEADGGIFGRGRRLVSRQPTCTSNAQSVVASRAQEAAIAAVSRDAAGESLALSQQVRDLEREIDELGRAINTLSPGDESIHLVSTRLQGPVEDASAAQKGGSASPPPLPVRVYNLELDVRDLREQLRKLKPPPGTGT